MKKVLLDENLPQPLRANLTDFEVITVGYMGWSGIQNGELISLIDGDFDVFITGDKNLRYQQNLADRTVAIVEVPFTRLDDLLTILPAILRAVESSTPGSYLQPR